MKNFLQKTALGLCVFAVLSVNAQIKPVQQNIQKVEKPSLQKKTSSKINNEKLISNRGENFPSQTPVNNQKRNYQILPSDQSIMGAVIFSEDFGDGTIPQGWETIDNTGQGQGVWEWVASFSGLVFGSTTSSNGFMMVNSDGAGSAATQDAELISPSFNCVGKSVIVLKFQDVLRQYGASVGDVSVSTNKVNWNSVYQIGPALGQDELSANPGFQTIDISSFAANKPTVFIRFKYTAAWDYYWMIDDISVEEVVPFDGKLDAILSPGNICAFADGTPVSVRITNEGTDVMSAFDLGYSLDGAQWIVESPGLVLNPGDTAVYDFTATANLSGITSHTLSVEIMWSQDNAQSNNKMDITIKEYLKEIVAEPLVNSFSSLESLDGWVIIDNSDFRKFNFIPESGNLRIYASTDVSNSDWLISSCVYLEAGKDYGLAFKYITGGQIHKLKITYGTTPDSIGQTEIIDDIEVSNTELLSFSKIITPSASGTYYISINDHSDAATGAAADVRWLDIDDFSLLNMGSAEAGILNIKSPVSACDLTADETITITINNLGSSDITGFDVSYSINGGTPVSENVGTFSVAPGESADYPFTTHADLSAMNNYKISAELVVSGDINKFNDTISVNLKKLKTDLNSDSLLEQFNNKLPQGWKVMNVDYPDSASWLDTYTVGGNNVMILPVRSDGLSNDWVFSQCLYVEAGSYYKIGFTYWNEASSTHQLDVALTSNQDDLGDIYPVFNTFDAITNQNFTDTSTIFQSTVTGNLYLGVHCSGGTAGKFVAFDNLSMLKLSENDLELVSIKSPVDGTCEFSNAENVTVTVRNNGITDITSFQFSYQIDGGAPVTETVTTSIPLGTTYDYTFTTAVDLSSTDNHEILVYGNLTGDENQTNDSLSTTVFETITNIPPDSALNDFTGGIPLGWSIQNYDNPGVASWYAGSFVGGNQAMFFETDGAGVADDWLFTNCIYMEQGINYIAGFRYWNADDDSTHTISLQLCTSADNTSASLLLDPFAFANSSFFKDTIVTFTVPNTGIYYLAVNCQGSIGPNATMSIDNFVLYKTAALDLALVNAVTPTTGSCTLSTDETITVSVANAGVNPFTDFKLTYIIDGVDTVSEDMNDVFDPGLPPIDKSFGQVANLSVPGTHVIKVYGNLPGDENPSNDTLEFTVYSIHKDLETEEIHNNFETIEEYAGWRAEDAVGQSPWFRSTYQPKDNSLVSLAFVADSGANADSWYFSPCINVVGGTTYTYTFFYKDDAPKTSLFTIKLSMGMEQTIAGMTEDFFEDTVSSNSGYTKASYPFTPTASGDYYIGMQIYGSPDTVQRILTVENIHIFKPAAPVAMFSSTVDLINTLVIYFNDQSTGGIDTWSWDYGDGSPVETDQNPVHLYPDKVVADYNVCLTVTNGLGQSTYCDSITVYGPDSKNEPVNFDNTISYYPVPANNNLTLKISGENSTINSVRILNTVGQVVVSAKVTNTGTYQLNTSELPVGFYYLQVVSDKGVINKKLLINR